MWKLVTRCRKAAIIYSVTTPNRSHCRTLSRREEPFPGARPKGSGVVDPDAPRCDDLDGMQMLPSLMTSSSPANIVVSAVRPA
jgi:hypothetical protein